MIFIINKNTSIKEIKEKLKLLKSTKIFDAEKFAGKISWGEDALTFQKRLRNEWE